MNIKDLNPNDYQEIEQPKLNIKDLTPGSYQETQPTQSWEKYRKKIEKPITPTFGQVAGGFGQTALDIGKGTWEGYKESARGILGNIQELKEEAPKKEGIEQAKGIGEFALRSASDVLTGVWAPITATIETAIPEELKETIGKGIKAIEESDNPIAEKLTDTVGYIKENWEDLDYDTQKNLEAVLNIGLSLIGEKPFVKAGQAISKSKSILKGIADDVVKPFKEIPPSGTPPSILTKIKRPVEGIAGIGQELTERIPRAAERGIETLGKGAERAARLKTVKPEIAEAIKSNLDDRIINTVTTADDETLKAFREALDIAEESTKKIGIKKQPSIVGGNKAIEQYNIITKEKKRIGQSLGDEVARLSKDTKIDLDDGFKAIDDVLKNQGVDVYKVGGKTKFDFSKSNFAPNERIKIEELYNLSREGGVLLSPAQIRAKDNLFSKLQRTSNFEGVGNIIVNTDEGTKSLFGVFRDTFSKKLDTVSPTIRNLNKQYRDIAMIVDDIDNSILKVPNLNIKKTANPAEFAKVGLRRISGEAQSSAIYEEVVNQMDTLARELGYVGANPKDVSAFAQELRTLFPDTIPTTGFTGGIKTGIRAGLPDIAERISRVGTPGLIDKQRALRGLLGKTEKAITETKIELPKAKTEIKLPQAKDKIKIKVEEVPKGHKKIESFKDFEKAKDLTPENTKLETKAFEKILKEEDAIIKKYIKENTENGITIVNTDNFRKYFEGYVGSNAAAFQEPSSYLSKRMFTKSLENTGNKVIFTSGGSGTGKSSALNNLSEYKKEIKDSASIFDSNLSSELSAKKKFLETINAGKMPVIYYTYREIDDAFVNGIVKRMKTNAAEMGRLVPNKVIAKNHIDSWRIAKEFDDLGYKVKYVDNSLGKDKSKLVLRKELETKIKYPSIEELTKRLNNRAKELYNEGKITKEQYKGYIE